MKLYKIFSILTILFLLAGCGGGSAGTNPAASTEAPAAAAPGKVKLTLGAYTTPREAYRELIPNFPEAVERTNRARGRV
jgi:hypothetical protein